MRRGSYIVDAQEAAVALFRATDGLAGVQVEYAWPADEAETECIWGGGDVDIDNELAAMKAGTKPVDEEFVLDFAIDVFLDGSDQAAADRRALELFAACEGAIAAVPRLGLVDRNFLWARTGRSRITRFYNTTGRGTRLVFGIRCKARLR